MSNNRCLAVMATAILIHLSIAGSAFADSYHVAFSAGRNDDDGAMRHAAVTATVTPDKGKIRLNRSGADTGLYNQWATFLLDIEAKDSTGALLEVEYEPHGVWNLPKWRKGNVTIEYKMILQHDRFPNEPGDDELANATSYGVMWTGRALFIEGRPSDEITVSFTGPDDWRVSSPWQPTNEHSTAFAPRNTDELLNSAFFAGVHSEEIVEVSDITAVLATGPDMTAERQLYAQTLQTYLPEYASLFGASTVATPLIIGIKGNYWGGGVMGRSISLNHGGALSAQTVPMVLYIVAHETFHLWNTQWEIDQRRDYELEWLKEGSAEYYTWLSSMRLKQIPFEMFLGEIANRWATYRNALQDDSIAAAGKTKLESENSYDLVYSGGMMLTLALDLKIRRETNNEKSFDDVLKLIHKDYAAPAETPLSRQQLIKAVKHSTGVDTRKFLNKHLMNKDALHVTDLFAYMGICLSETVTDNTISSSAVICSPANSSAAENRENWLRGN